MLRSITLPQHGLAELQADARAGGYTFIDGLVREWDTAEQRFDGPGELLLGYFDGSTMIAVGGLTRDPFLGMPEVGRIRKVYVLSAYRERGIGAELVRSLIEKAKESFTAVRLRAENARAARLYERLGFAPLTDPNATHMMGLSEGSPRRAEAESWSA